MPSRLLLVLLVFGSALISGCRVDPYADVLPTYDWAKQEQYAPETRLDYLYNTLGPNARIKKTVNLCNKADMLYVKMHNHSSLNSDEFMDIVMRTLERNTFFKEVVTREPTIYVNVEPELGERLPDGDMWYDADDPLTIGDIKQRYAHKNFLILEVRMQGFGEYEPLTVTASLIDPNTHSTIVMWREQRAVWYWIGGTQTDDMMEDINEWFANVDKFCECECNREDN